MDINYDFCKPFSCFNVNSLGGGAHLQIWADGEIALYRGGERETFQPEEIFKALEVVRYVEKTEAKEAGLV